MLSPRFSRDGSYKVVMSWLLYTLLVLLLFLVVAPRTLAEADPPLLEPFNDQAGVRGEPSHLPNGAVAVIAVDSEHLAREGGGEAESVDVLVIGRG